MRKLTGMGIFLLALFTTTPFAGDTSTAQLNEPVSGLLPPLPRASAEQDNLPEGHLPEPKPLLLFATGFLGLALGIHIKRLM